MNQQIVTLIAAGVAALASLANVAVNVYFARRASRETQFRELLKPHLTQLGEELHSVVACSQVVARRADLGKPLENWLEKASKACEALKGLHRKVKYPLWGIGEGIRELTRLASWVAHTKDNGARRDEILKAANALRIVVDEAIKEAFLEGCPPSPDAQVRVRAATERLRNLWDRQPDAESEAELDGAA